MTEIDLGYDAREIVLSLANEFDMEPGEVAGEIIFEGMQRWRLRKALEERYNRDEAQALLEDV